MRLGLTLVRRASYRRCLPNTRWYSEKPTPTLGTTIKPDPHTAQHDYIGAPDKDSNIRPIIRHIPPNETPLGKRLRERRLEVESWNQDFWSRHNQRFYEEKEIFIKAYKAKGIDDISADKMSVFYKHFLDKNRKIHIFYNISWYAKNLDLLLLSAQYGVQNLWRKLRRTNST